MERKNIKNWTKEICLFILFVVEVIFTFLGFGKRWSEEIKMSLLFADVLTLFNGLLSIINKWDNEHKEMQTELEKEHSEIKGAIELYKDIERQEYVTCFEGDYITTQCKQGVEIWIISNSVAEPSNVLVEMLKNLRKGVQYRYIIPKHERCDTDVQNTFKALCEKARAGDEIKLQYIQDDLFDFLPTDIVDVLFYCNPPCTDYKTNMRIFYSFQRYGMETVYYKPISPPEKDIKKYFEDMRSWKEREWQTLYYKK